MGGSLLRCNYYHEYLACEEEDFCERYILVEVDWELLSEERLVILLKIAQIQLNGTWETKPVPKYEPSCFRKYIDLFSNSLRSNENNLIYFRKQLGNKGKRKFSASRSVLRVGVMGEYHVNFFLDWQQWFFTYKCLP